MLACVCRVFIRVAGRTRERRRTYGNLKVDELLGECAHLVAEAERVLAGCLGGKGKVALALLFALHNDLAHGAFDNVVNVKRATGLHLLVCIKNRQPSSMQSPPSCRPRLATYGKVKGNLVVGVLGAGKEARLFVRLQAVRQRRGHDIAREEGDRRR